MNDASPDGSQAKRIFLWLFLFFNCFYILTSSGRVRITDEVMAVFQTESLVLRRSTAVPQAVEAKIYYGKYDQKGQPQSANAPAQAIAAIPWYLAGQHLLLRLPGIPPGAHSVVTDFAIVLSNATFSALAVALVFWVQLQLGIAVPSAAAMAGVVGLGTPVFCYSAWFFSEPLGGAVLLLALAALITGSAGIDLSARACVWGGLALGVALWVRPTYLIYVPLFFAAILLSPRSPTCRWRAVLIVAAVVGVFGLAALARNSMLYGSPFDFGYPEAAERGRRLNTFEAPFFTGLFAFLFSPGKSVFLFAPPILAALWALPRMWQRNRSLAFLISAVPVASLLLYSKYSQFEGGYSFGPRYLYIGILFLCLALGLAWQEGSATMRKVIVALFVVGLVVNGIGLATSPLEDMATGKYYDEQFNYRLDYNPLAGQLDLLMKYMTSDAPAPIGRGFDRWFVFLHKAGINAWTLLAIGLLPAAGAGLAVWKLWGVCRDDRQSASIG